MLLIPVRQYLLPKFFKGAHLQDMDAAEYEEAPAIRYNFSFEVSYMLLSRVSPVTHSVGNCVKHVVVIVSPINSLGYSCIRGTGISLAGVFLYSRVKSIKGKLSKPKTASSLHAG